MKILVTGGAGFIGSHLSEHLLDAGHDVMAFDDLSAGSKSNVDYLLDRPGFRLELGSVTDPDRVGPLVDACDATVHLAAAVGVRLVLDEPVRAIEGNVLGASTVLAAAARRRRAVLLASTSEVYGASARIPAAEDDDLTLAPAGSRWAYAWSKALDECLGLAYARAHGVPVIIARLFNTVGPRQSGRYGMVLPTLAAQAVRGEPITVFGTGEQTRCFTHVRDVAEVLRRLLESPGATGQIYNVGTDREVTINRLAELVRDIAGSASSIHHVPYAVAYGPDFVDVPRRRPDVSKLLRAIGFRPATSLEQIVVDVVVEQRQLAAAG